MVDEFGLLIDNFSSVSLEPMTGVKDVEHGFCRFHIETQLTNNTTEECTVISSLPTVTLWEL
jgi:hypothetical protein